MYVCIIHYSVFLLIYYLLMKICLKNFSKAVILGKMQTFPR